VRRGGARQVFADMQDSGRKSCGENSVLVIRTVDMTGASVHGRGSPNVARHQTRLAGTPVLRRLSALPNLLLGDFHE
jgi:hypothetical protein